MMTNTEGTEPVTPESGSRNVTESDGRRNRYPEARDQCSTLCIHSRGQIYMEYAPHIALNV